jgi:hypothetical protein
MSDQLQKDLTAVLNRHCQENESDTPDFILAQFLLKCLEGFNVATRQRHIWHTGSAPLLGTANASPTPEPNPAGGKA